MKKNQYNQIEALKTLPENVKPLPLSEEPIALSVSIHMQNLFLTYGEANVRAMYADLFGMHTFIETKVPRKTNKAV